MRLDAAETPSGQGPYGIRVTQRKTDPMGTASRGGVGQGLFLDNRVDMAPPGTLRDFDTLKVIWFMLLSFSLSGQAMADSQTTPGSLGGIPPGQHLLHGVAAEDGIQLPKYSSSHQGGCLCCLCGSVTGIILPVTI